EDHVPVYIPEPEHLEDLVPAEDEAPTPPLLPFFLSPWTPPLLPIPLPAPSTSRRADIPEADTPPWNRLLLTTPRPSCKVRESTAAAAAARQPGPTMAYRVDYSLKDHAAVRAEIEALEARVAVLETQARRYEWQRQDADDRATRHIMRI
ncbi:hypothetical protein Tco_0124551, partial [Tanacetum coccineum]